MVTVKYVSLHLKLTLIRFDVETKNTVLINEPPVLFCESSVVGGAIPKEYIPSVADGIREAANSGILAGFPVLGLRADIYDGSYHEVDSSEMAFHIAGSLAFKDAMKQGAPVLLEPIASLKVTVPDDYTGDVMGDLNKRRGRVLGHDSDRRWKASDRSGHSDDRIVRVLYGACSMTGGRGTYAYEFARYEQAPSDIQEKEIAARASKVEKLDE